MNPGPGPASCPAPDGRLPDGRFMDEHLIQSQKMAALGEISAGIAHEINTPLAIIAQAVEWMENLLEAEGMAEADLRREVAASVAQIGQQVERCRSITHNMLSFARKSEAVHQDIDLPRLLDDMLRLAEKEYRHAGVRFIRDFDPGLPLIPTDPQLLRQVALNLIINAAQAVGQGGEVRVRAGLDCDSPFFAVSDTGPGVPPEHQERIFNPFFTTKPPGQGTGLGLSICMAIVARLGGAIRVDSPPGQGATFTVRLPLTPTPQGAKP